MKDLLLSLLILAILGGFIYLVIWIPGSFFCGQRWSGSGMQTRYGITSGCQINYKSRWIPETSYRVL